MNRELWRTCAEDMRANRGSPKATVVVVLFRLCSAARGRGDRPRLVALPLGVIYRLFTEWVLGIELPWSLSPPGPGLEIQHGVGLVVHAGTRIGCRVTLAHGVTLGVRRGDRVRDGAPILGNDVLVGAHAQILGPVRVGNGARIGAGAVVLTDAPDGSTAAGNPASIKRRLGGAEGLSNGRTAG